VIRQVKDPLGEESHLILCAAGVSFVELIFFQVDVAHDRRGWIPQVPDRPRLMVERGRKTQESDLAR